MQGIDAHEPFSLPPLQEIAIPFGDQTIVVRANQKAFKRRVTTSLDLPDREEIN